MFCFIFFFLRSHCECDVEFFECLTKQKQKYDLAELIGNFFFKIGKLKCIKGLPCDPISDDCTNDMSFTDFPKTWYSNPKVLVPQWAKDFSGLK